MLILLTSIRKSQSRFGPNHAVSRQPFPDLESTLWLESLRNSELISVRCQVRKMATAIKTHASMNRAPPSGAILPMNSGAPRAVT